MADVLARRQGLCADVRNRQLTLLRADRLAI
jgi:hypothetical protein